MSLRDIGFESPKVYYIGFGDVEKQVFFLFVFPASGLNLETVDFVLEFAHSVKGFPRTLAFGSKLQQGDAPLAQLDILGKPTVCNMTLNHVGSRRTRRRARSLKVHYIGFGDVEKQVPFSFLLFLAWSLARVDKAKYLCYNTPRKAVEICLIFLFGCRIFCLP